jgi:hypothetical protein
VIEGMDLKRVDYLDSSDGFMTWLYEDYDTQA